MMPIMPSVTRKAGTPSPVMRMPFTAPTSMPKPRPTATDSEMFPVECSSSATISDVIAAIDPIERSILSGGDDEGHRHGHAIEIIAVCARDVQDVVDGEKLVTERDGEKDDRYKKRDVDNVLLVRSRRLIKVCMRRDSFSV